MTGKVLNAAAVVAMLLVLCGLGLTFWAGNQRNARSNGSCI